MIELFLYDVKCLATAGRAMDSFGWGPLSCNVFLTLPMQANVNFVGGFGTNSTQVNINICGAWRKNLKPVY